ncbi:MAG TPA: polyprenyl synthetase family protein, partial [Trueperaceae bacterium]|nr:polyprenyl synthetase family protein [Trueperaceae bacterium]
LLSTEAHGGNWSDALNVAVGLELFQNWILIHDDIEDESDERRGRATLHKMIGDALAINVGDALHVYMWQVLNNLELAKAHEIRQEFLTMIHRTAEGQHLELSWIKNKDFDIDENDYLAMVSRKTAYYTVVYPLILGALAANKIPDPRIIDLGIDLGIAFQIRDDVLNLSQNANYGKEFAGDLYEAKRTLILVKLFKQVTKNEEKDLKRILNKKRTNKTKEEIDYVLAMIAKYNVLEQSQNYAEIKAAAGLELFEDVFKILGRPAVTTHMSGLLKSLAYRSH